MTFFCLSVEVKKLLSGGYRYVPFVQPRRQQYLPWFYDRWEFHRIKPRTDEHVFLDKFSLTSFICWCVREKIDKFSLTRSLVKENLTRKACSSYIRVSELVKKLVKENLLVCTRLKIQDRFPVTYIAQWLPRLLRARKQEKHDIKNTKTLSYFSKIKNKF